MTWLAWLGTIKFHSAHDWVAWTNVAFAVLYTGLDLAGRASPERKR
jgi:hypothetical protein